VTALILVTGIGYLLPEEGGGEPIREVLRPYACKPNPTISEILESETEPVWDWGTLLLVAACMSLCMIL